MPPKLTTHFIARALAIAVAGVAFVSIAGAQVNVTVTPAPGGAPAQPPASAPARTHAPDPAGGLPAAPVTTAPAPAGVPGQPGVAPHPKAPGAEGAPANPLESAADSGSNIYVDDSFAAVDKLRDADSKAHQGQAEVAIKAYQEIINQFGQKLVYLNNGSYVSITDYVRERLLEMPAVKDGGYDQLFGADAQAAVDKAVAQHDLTNLIRTCDLYFPATASMNGLSKAAEWYFESGEFAAAGKLWQSLLSHPMVDHGVIRKPLFLFHALVATGLAGDKAKALQLRERLAQEFPHATGPVNGADADLLQAADGILALPPLASLELSPDEWPAFQGAPSHAALLNVNSTNEARLWSIPLNDEGLSGLKRSSNPNPPQNNGQSYDRFGRPQANDLNSYPVMSQGMVFLNNGERVTALSANAGTPLWAYPEVVTIRAENAANGFGMRNAAHDSVSVADDQVFAVLPAAAPPANPGADRMGRMRYMGVSSQNTRLVCLNRQTGTEMWSTSASSINAKADKLGVLTFVGSPIVTRQGVYVMARKIGDGGFTELYMIRLDRDSGNLSWYCYLCSTTMAGANYGMPGVSSSVPIPTLVDDVIYIATGQGADLAVDANAGRILWLSINDAAKTPHDPNEIYQPNRQNQAASWKDNPPLVYGDMLVTCDPAQASAAFRIYNRSNGKLLRSISEKELGLTAVDMFAGIVGSAAIVVGDRVMAFDLNGIANGAEIKTLWDSTFTMAETGRPHGRCFLAANCLYVPYEKGLIKLNPADGQSTFTPWPNTEKDVNAKPIVAKPGNLLVTSEQVVVLNDTEIAGYSKWETARDNRLAKIKEFPTDPSPYLALAEISFRTAHYPLAQDNMKRAVELATGAESPAPAGFVDRLYKTNLNFAQQLLLKTDTDERDRARFYFEECKLAARDAEQNTEWRLNFAELSLAQNNPGEAAAFYNQVLGDPALRNANFRRGEATTRGAVAAESLFHALITKKDGQQVYQRYEDQAAALLSRAQAAKDAAGLEQIVESFPNSSAAIAAATELADAAHQAHDAAEELKPLHWLSSRVSGDKKATVIAQTALAYAALPKHYFAAMAFADRGLLLFKDYSWKNAAGETMTFTILKNQIKASRPESLAEGRNPMLPQPVVQVTGTSQKMLPPDMDENSINEAILRGTLLTPIESSPLYRRPEFLFAFHDGAIHIFDTAKNAEMTPAQGKASDGPAAEGGIKLAENVPTELLGCVGDIAVFVQSSAAIGINLKDLKIAWTVSLGGNGASGNGAGREVSAAGNGPQAGVMVFNGGGGGGGGIVINGGGVIRGNRTFMGEGSNPNNVILAADPEVARQLAFSQLGGGGRAPGFTTLRIINNHLLAVVGDRLTATDIATGQPAWKNAAGAATEAVLDGGAPEAVFGNEDVIVAQVNDPGEGKVLFRVFDAGTGKYRKQVELFQERPQWRMVSDDSTLFLVTDKAVEAYDLFNDRDAQPLWKRQDIHSPYPAATALTPDGLVVINGNAMDLVCLSTEGGETRWPAAGSQPVQLQLHTSGQKPAFIRSLVDGDTVIYQAPQGLAAYLAIPGGDSQVAWETSLQQPLPPLQDIAISDPYVVALASGPIENGTIQRAVRLFLLNHKGGKIYLNKAVQQSPQEMEGPLVKKWQLADNGIALEINDGIRFFHGKKTP